VTTPKRVRLPRGNHDALASSELGAEETFGNPQERGDTGDVTNRCAHNIKDGLITTEETARTTQWQGEETQSNRFDEGTDTYEGVEKVAQDSQRCPVGLFRCELLDPEGEQTLNLARRPALGVGHVDDVLTRPLRTPPTTDTHRKGARSEPRGGLPL